MKRNNNIFSLDYLIKPHTNSKYDFKSERIIKDNFYFNSPILDAGHFWTTGNVDLPALNKNQFLFFKDSLKIIPVMRTNNLSDGYKYKRILKEKITQHK